MKINKGQIISDIEATQLKKDIPVFTSGDTVEVYQQDIQEKT